MGERRNRSARSDVFAERHDGDDARCAVDAAKNAHGGKQGLALLKLNLLGVIPPVYFRLGASSARSMVEVFGGLSGNATYRRASE